MSNPIVFEPLRDITIRFYEGHIKSLEDEILKTEVYLVGHQFDRVAPLKFYIDRLQRLESMKKSAQANLKDMKSNTHHPPCGKCPFCEGAPPTQSPPEGTH